MGSVGIIMRIRQRISKQAQPDDYPNRCP